MLPISRGVKLAVSFAAVLMATALCLGYVYPAANYAVNRPATQNLHQDSDPVAFESSLRRGDYERRSSGENRGRRSVTEDEEDMEALLSRGNYDRRSSGQDRSRRGRHIIQDEEDMEALLSRGNYDRRSSGQDRSRRGRHMM